MENASGNSRYFMTGWDSSFILNTSIIQQNYICSYALSSSINFSLYFLIIYTPSHDQKYFWYLLSSYPLIYLPNLIIAGDLKFAIHSSNI